MARKASLFSGGSRSVSATINSLQLKPEAVHVVDVSEEALSKRFEERKLLPSHPLIFSCTGYESRVKRKIEYNFNQLTEAYPHHRNLINQILVGISLFISPGCSTKAIRSTYNSLPRFIIFLNDKKNLNSTKVICVADIDIFVFQAYKTYLISNFPKNSNNNRFYINIVRSCNALRKKYSGELLIGEAASTPIPPQRGTRQVEGYNRSQLKSLIRCCIKDIKAIKKFQAAYANLNHDSEQISVVSPGYNVRWQNDPDRRFAEILATIKNKWPDYPYNMPLDNVKSLFSRVKDDSEEWRTRARIDKALQTCSGNISFMNGELGRGAIFAAMHFVPDTIFPFLLLSLISTGFNVECLKYLMDDLNEHVFDCMLDPKNYVIIWGYKGRTDKKIPVRCKKYQAYGAYSLLKYVETIISKYKDSPHYVKCALFQFTRVKLATKNDEEGLLCTFYGANNRFSRMGTAFVKRHGLEKLIGSTIDSRKIRSGFATVAIEGGMTSSRLAEQFGHQDAQKLPDTVESHYLSDTASVAIKNNVIADIQRRLVADTCDYAHRIVTSKTLQHLRDSINSAKSEAERKKKIKEAARELSLEEKTIVHLLDAGSQTYILACEDMTYPTWPGNEDFVKNGQCRQFNKCCMCRQAVVFPEALPYIAKRIMDLEALQNMLPATEWIVNFGDELDAWNRILGAWNNKEQIDSSWEAAKNGNILLPKVMKGGTR